MKRLTTIFIALGFALGTLGSAAQQETPPPDDTAVDDGQAMVRFINASPNAAVEHVMMTSDQEDAGGIAVSDFGDVTYGSTSDYIAVPAGTYEVMVVLEAVEDADLARVVPAESFMANAGEYYTVALMGLVIPTQVADEPAMPEETEAQAEEGEVEAEAEEAAVADATDEPFMAWLQGLMAGDTVDQQGLDLRLMVLDDRATETLAADETWVRIVHAAPGTDPVSLVVLRADDGVDEAAANGNGNDVDATVDAVNDDERQTEIVATVSYGEAGEYMSLGAGDTLEVRTEDGEAVILELADLDTGMLHTVFVTGTPVEPVPIEAVVASTQPMQVEDPTDVDDADVAETDANGEAEVVTDEATREDAVAETDANDEAEAAPGVAAAIEAENGEFAMVRFMHAAPHTSIEQVLLLEDNGAVDGLVIGHFAAAEYAQVSDYVAIPEGSYEVSVVLDMAATDQTGDIGRTVPSETFSAHAGEFYTITLMGVVLPEEYAQTQEDADEGFLAWLEDLFTSDDVDRGALELRVMILDDEAVTELEQDEIRVRVVHTAAGTEPVSLAVREADAEDTDLVETVGYGEASGYVSVTAADTLEIRTEDGEAVIVDLADHDLQAGMLHTIFVTGTPVEDVPIEAVVASTDAAEGTEDGAGRTDDTEMMVAATPVRPVDPATQRADHAFVRLLHAAPTASMDEIILSTDDAVGGVSLEAFTDAQYMDTTQYMAIPAATYDVIVSMALTEEAGAELQRADLTAADLVPVETFTANAGEYYTLAFIGLVVPSVADQQQEGFFAWLQGLFTTDPVAAEDLALRVIVIEDHFNQVATDQFEVRIVHAAPATESLALVQVHDRVADDVNVHHTVAYGEISGYSTVNVADGPLEVRIEGSEVVVVDLAELESGMIHTIYVTGTPVEDAPIDAVVTSTVWQEPTAAPAN